MKHILLILICCFQTVAYSQDRSFHGVDPTQVEVTSVDGLAQMNGLNIRFLSAEGEPTRVFVMPNRGYGISLSDIEQYFTNPLKNILAAAELLGKTVTIKTDNTHRAAILIDLD